MVQKFDFQELDLKGAYLIKPFYATDNRGGLIKDYNVDTFKANGIDHDLKEVFYTISKRGVIRATHFQLVRLSWCAAFRAMSMTLSLICARILLLLASGVVST